jgi:hypothetical protein
MKSSTTVRKPRVKKITSKPEVLETNVDLEESIPSTTFQKAQINQWQQELDYIKLNFRLSIIGLILIILGFGISSWQIYLNTAQSAKLDKSSRANVQLSTLNHVINLDQVFIQRPYLKA